MADFFKGGRGAGRPPRTDEEKRMELTEHLAELRTRLIRSAMYLLVGAVFAYQIFTPLYNFLYRPLEKEMVRLNKLRTRQDSQRDIFVIAPPTGDPKQDYNNLSSAIRWVYEHPSTTPLLSNAFRNFHEPFMVRLKLSVIFGFVLVMPFIIRELALFILPALTPQEKKPLKLLIPISTVLLIAGVFVAYRTMFYAMTWFLSYIDDFPPPNNLLQDPNDYVIFFVKMMAAFGIAFQLPVILMAGAYAGLVKSAWLLKNWRFGILLAACGGLFTPSNDLVSMAMLSIPMLMLYFLSYFLVRMIERMKAKNAPKPA